MYALVDCNNFFASCERVINPRLIGKPVVILSNNDGCIVARSNEAKAMGIPMGAPYFKWKEQFEKHNVRVFSSNYLLYGDMSRRVMETLEVCMPDVSIYSIDEAFCDVSGVRDLSTLAQQTKQQVEQWTGIPVSIGIGPTKTLAKLANEIAKKQAAHNGILTFHTAQDALPFFQHMPIGDVWGIGRSFGFQLPTHGIHTVADFVHQPETWIKNMLGSSGVSILHELLGHQSEHTRHTSDIRKSVVRSRSFGTRVTKKEDIMDALTYFADRAGQKLRSEGLRTRVVQPFFSTSRFSPPQYYASKTIQLPEATHDSRVLISVAQSVVHSLFKDGPQYTKAGIVCTDIVSAEQYQKSLFSTEQPRDARILDAYDAIKTKFGSDMINIGRTREKKYWHMKRALLSTHERKNITTVPTVLCK
jgi:DNA polymerase V